MMELYDKRMVLSGGGEFLGRHVVRTLHERGCTEIVVIHHPAALRDQRRDDPGAPGRAGWARLLGVVLNEVDIRGADAKDAGYYGYEPSAPYAAS